jgi:hypothetical chaperone protein
VGGVLQLHFGKNKVLKFGDMWPANQLSALSMQTLAIDFGTTNTVFATAKNGVADIIALPGPEQTNTIRTALAFQRTGRGEPMTEIGPWAIEMFLDNPENTRFLQSFKSFAASASFSETQIFSRRLGFNQLLEMFLQHSFARAGLSNIPKRIIMGRPVTFVGQNPNDALAMQRYGAALQALGAQEVLYVHEPVAAAYFYAQRLTTSSTVLVGDFGGGTSDFSLLQFEGEGRVTALGQSGVGIAGDTLDYRIIDNVVTPRLGKGGSYTSWGKTLPIPAHYFASFARWNELSLMNRPAVLAELRDFAKTSPEGDALEALVALIEGGEAYRLYQSVSKAKAELSKNDVATFHFKGDGLLIEKTIERGEFETWIADDVARMLASANDLLMRTGKTPGDVDRVFLTGGTSFVKAIRSTFAAHFGADKIETGDELISIAKGLALIGADENAQQWAVKV